jgi:rhamnosyltransferase
VYNISRWYDMKNIFSRTAAVVVLYNPEQEAIKNIATYAGQANKVYAVDNSDSLANGLVGFSSETGNIEYLPQGENLGVAAALNIGARRAIEEGYDFLLTMDQDSRATPGMVQAMLDCISGRETDRVGIVAPFHAVKSDPQPARGGCEEVLTVMTSGNLINLDVYRRVGPFLDGLFIDYVDDEYCLRLNAAGFKVIRCNDVVLEHQLGNISGHNYRGRTVYVSNQNSMRRYYMVRNRFHVIERYRSLYPEYCARQLANLRGEIKGIILFEEHKFSKLWMAAKGYLDYRRGRMGRVRSEKRVSGKLHE